jgi:hypothetical protein
MEFFLKGRPLVNGLEGVEIKQLEGNYRVTIQNCQIDKHDGEMMVKAMNEHGQAESRARLTVEPEEEESRSAPTFIKDIEDQASRRLIGNGLEKDLLPSPPLPCRLSNTAKRQCSTQLSGARQPQQSAGSSMDKSWTPKQPALWPLRPARRSIKSSWIPQNLLAPSFAGIQGGRQSI